MTIQPRRTAHSLTHAWFVPLAVAIPAVLSLGATATAQPLIDLTPPQPTSRPSVSTWVDDVVWRERTDGTPSLVVERILPGSNTVVWELRRGDRVVSFAGVIPESVAELRSLSGQLEAQNSPLAVLRGDRLVTLSALGGEVDPRDRSNELILSSPPIDQGLEELPSSAAGDYESHRMDPRSIDSRGIDPRSIDSRRAQRINEPAPVTYGDDLDLGRQGVAPVFPSSTMGFRLSDFRAERFRGYDTPVLSGAMVEEVVKGSLADRSGLKAGMIIVAVDGRRIDSATEVERWLLDRAQETEIALLAYEGRQLRRIRMSLIVSNEEVPSSELDSLPLSSPANSESSSNEVEELELDGGSMEDLPAPMPGIETVDENAGDETAGEAAADSSADSQSSRRGILGGILRRENEERPLANATRDASIEALRRRIERQQRQLEEQQRELNRLIAELEQLEKSREDEAKSRSRQ